MNTDPRKIKIFISYADEDRQNNWLEKIKRYCLTFEVNQNIEVWDDGKILLGQNWDHVIQDRLAEADIVLLLISNDFLLSDYISRVELVTAIERHHKKLCTVIPIFLRYCILESHTHLTQLQGFPKGLFFSEMKNEIDRYYADLQQEIKKIINEIRANTEFQKAVNNNNTGVTKFSKKQKKEARKVVIQENASANIIIAHSNSVLSNTMKDFFLTQVKSERKYKKWAFDVHETTYTEKQIPLYEFSAAFITFVITSQTDIDFLVANSNSFPDDVTSKKFQRVILWLSEKSLEEKLPIDFKKHPIVAGTTPKSVIERIYAFENERLEFMNTTRQKFCQQLNVYMLYDYSKDHTNLLRIRLKKELESRKEVLPFYTPPNAADIETQLKASKGVIIFYGACEMNWYNHWQSEIQKMAALEERSVCLSDPEKVNKLDRDVNASFFLPIMVDENHLKEDVDQFVDNLKSKVWKI